MQISPPNYHLKLLEMCECYLETDFMRELQRMATATSKDPEEDALKYLALTILYAINEQGRKLSFKKKKEKISVTLQKEEKESLPAPPPEIFEKIMAIVRAILHLEEDKGAMELALGLKSGHLDVTVKAERKKDKESLKFKFPKPQESRA